MFAQTKIWERLNRDHPRLFTEKYGWLYLCAAAVFIVLYINHQQPYGLYTWQHPYKWLIISGFGIISTLIYALIYELLPRIFSHYFSKANWTIKKETITLAVFFLIAGTVNWIYALMELSYFRASVSSFFRLLFYTFETGIVPVMFLSSYVRLRNEKRKNRELSEIVDRNIPDLNTTIVFEYNKLTFDLNKVVYINKSVNDLQFHELQQDECVIRTCAGTIKDLLFKLTDYPFMKHCHESFVVNTHYIKSVDGNSNGLEIQFRHCKDTVTVSRHFTVEFMGKYPSY
ncbi:MAG: LytTR family DNA-binding domain-containing protein [Paludibacter sp.]